VESGEAIVHDLDSGATVFTLGAHEEGAWLVSGSRDGTVKFWSMNLDRATDSTP
jgi:hypothetical protein